MKLIEVRLGLQSRSIRNRCSSIFIHQK